MPEPIQRNQRYMPGLDGLRAIAVLAVIAYHLGFGWAPGGLLGVAVFFTLSGYLITDLLLGQWWGGRMRLGNFWIRRARRLLPALFVMLVVVTAWITIADPDQLDKLRGAVISSALYVNNWWLIDQHVSYFARFAPAVAARPPVVAGSRGAVLSGVAVASAARPSLCQGARLLTGHPPPPGPDHPGARNCLGHLDGRSLPPGFDSTRVYDGTDTRAFGLLFGAALAMVWPSQRLSTNVSAGARRSSTVWASPG